MRYAFRDPLVLNRYSRFFERTKNCATCPRHDFRDLLVSQKATRFLRMRYAFHDALALHRFPCYVFSDPKAQKQTPVLLA